ncbi:DegT/DnrJ/EryC1/StrS family aminotransferase [Dyadobacter bucti]|uniref:DegT/DnrJ/EryC1/StrS family aminotransferase n=1 Tax=Dyadobacter bucti TaxID=2572203 RepID=UPI0011084F23|nr:DegT/DnrJ/EryC1/StrS family aminotransferase [Dyadobacter bucti]
MMKIQMVDLKGQYAKIKPEVDQAIQNVIDTTAFINGPQVKTFSADLAEYLSVKHVITCANGTDALQIALMALGLEQGDEVIVPCFTYVATVEVIALLKLKPVVTEVDPDTFNITAELIEKAITPRTKAIVPVHLFGQSADMAAIMAIARKHKLYVIEDTAQALGAEYVGIDGSSKKAGTIGDIGCTSFFPSKNLGCYGDGGALYTNNDELATLIRKIANHGQAKKYHHEVIGVNSRLDTIQAAILSIKLRQLDQYCKARRDAADYYDQHLAGLSWLQIPKRHQNSTHVFHQYTLKLVDPVDRNALKDHLLSLEIPSMVYYPIPLHLQEAFKTPDYNEGDFPVSERLCSQVLSLPVHTEMETEQQDYIIAGIKSFRK